MQSGAIAWARGERWSGVDSALQRGFRGLPGGSSLAKLLAERAGVRNMMALPKLTEDGILEWADAHRARTGDWPTKKSGPVGDTTWAAVEAALQLGSRGLPGGSSLPKLFAERRGRRNRKAQPRLTLELVASWAKEHRERIGRWPARKSGPVGDTTWHAIESALQLGSRGLPKGLSLTKLFRKVEELP